MRYSMAVTPKNYLLFACHLVNFTSQLTQGYRWYDYNYLGGKATWEKIRAEAKEKADSAAAKTETLVDEAKAKASGAVEAVKSKTS